jgi:tRNA pseudouridine38-40 synthase
MRYFLEIAYRGTAYFGWQTQKQGPTVQSVVTNALNTITQKKTTVSGCGRTDSGVHARQFFLHTDMEEINDTIVFVRSLNGLLPSDIAVISIRKVKEDADARFSAFSRTYRYYYTLRKDPFLEDLSARLYKIPDLELMNKAANIITGKHDFKCFSKLSDVKHYECEVKKAYWEQNEDVLVFTITANRFLRNMVRAITGTMLDIGYEKKSLEDLHIILEGKDRKKAGKSAPASGLFLEKIEYPKDIWLQ